MVRPASPEISICSSEGGATSGSETPTTYDVDPGSAAPQRSTFTVSASYEGVGWLAWVIEAPAVRAWAQDRGLIAIEVREALNSWLGDDDFDLSIIVTKPDTPAA